MSTAAQRLTFLTGPLMAVSFLAVSLAVVIWSPLAILPEIHNTCGAFGLTDSRCAVGARTAGFVTITAFLLVIIAALWSMRYFDQVRASPLLVPPLLKNLFLVLCFGVIFVHLVEREFGPVYGLRIDELTRFRTLISLENLLWPLLIQLLLVEQDWRLRMAINTALMLIATLTIFRTTQLTIFVLGFVLPLAYFLWDRYRTAWTRKALTAVAIQVVLIALVGAAFGWRGWVDTQSRAIESASVVDTQSRTIESASVAAQPSGTVFELNASGRFRQRVAEPLYEAAIVRYVSNTKVLPSILDEFKRKFRLSAGPNLDEFLNRIIDPGGSPIVGWTYGYFGEGAAYFGQPVLWTLGGPLLFLVAWLLLGRARLETSAIITAGLWRSSITGLIALLPAVVLQLAGLFVMSRFGRLTNSTWLMAPLVSRLTAGLLLIAVSATMAAQAWPAVDGSQRKELLQLTFATKDGCTFDERVIADLPDRVDQAVSELRRTIKSGIVAYTPTRIDLTLPYGGELRHHLSELITPVSSAAVCAAADEPSPVQIIGVKAVPSRGMVLAELLALAATVLTAVLLAQMLATQILLHKGARVV